MPLRHLNDKNSLIGMEFFDLDLQSINNGIFFYCEKYLYIGKNLIGMSLI